MVETLRTLIVDDEPLAVERLQVICARLPGLIVTGTASEGASALRLIEALAPDLVLLDLTMPGMDGLDVARALRRQRNAPAVVFVTAHDEFAVEAFDLDAVDYVLKPVAPERLERAIGRALNRRGESAGVDSRTNETSEESPWLTEFWVPYRSELLRIAASDVDRIDAERDYVRLHVGSQSYLMLHTISGLEERLDPVCFIRIHRSTILRRDFIRGLRHDGLGTWSAEIGDGSLLRIGRTYLANAKAMAGR
jgi:two-component system response regulator AlgR